MIPRQIFKAYDVRGIVEKELSPENVYLIGKSIGTEARKQSCKALCVGIDGRLSGEWISKKLISGIISTGTNVYFIGKVTTPMLYFSNFFLKTQTGVMVTGSHNPPEYNGFKIVINNKTLSSNEIINLYKNIIEDNLISDKNGEVKEENISEEYFREIISDIKIKNKIRIVVDAGNGIAGKFAPDLFSRLGCEVEKLFCDVDGSFPNHHPDPSDHKNLKDLVNHLKNSKSEIGIAFDGDGDRLGVVTKNGNIINPDRQLMLFCMDILSRKPKSKIIYDVKCTANLEKYIKNLGGKPIMYRTGHSLIKKKMIEEKAELAGEMSGHLFFKDRWYGFDDGLYAAARLIEILSKSNDVTNAFEDIPDSINTPEIKIELKEGDNFKFLDEFKRSARFPNAVKIIKIDGLRVEYKYGFGLIRASNTTPVLSLRFEANSLKEMDLIQADFRKEMKKVKDDIELIF